MKSIDKLRASQYVGQHMSLSEIADEIEAEIERDYMPKPKIEKNFNAMNSGITDISEALQNIAECNAAKCAMRQEVTHADVETMIGSIAAIADAYYMRLPVDADGEPIHVGDKAVWADKGTFEVCGINKDSVWFDGSDKEWVAAWANDCRHVKPRTLEDVLEDYVVEYQTRHARSEFGAEHFDHVDVHEMVKRCANEIRELLGGDAE